jgi:hypothetical protein
VGGSTLIGRVRDRVAELFQREPAEGVSPFEAVAIGAAIQAAAMTEPTTDDDDVPTLDALVMLRELGAPPAAPQGEAPATPSSQHVPTFPLGGAGASPANDPVAARVARTDPPASRQTPRGPLLSGKALQTAGWGLVGVLVVALLGIVWLLVR